MSVELGYWGIKGLAEVSRLTLKLAGVDFSEYNPESPQAWGERKASGEFEYPNLPFINVDGFKLTESGAIPWFVAKKFKPSLAGNTIEEEAQVQQVIGVIGDLKTELFKAMFTPDYKAALIAAAAADGKIATKLNHLKHALGDGHYLVGGHLTLADVTLAYFASVFHSVFESAEAECPFTHHATLLAHEQNVWSQPELVEYVASAHWKKPIMPPTMVPWLKF